MPCSVAAPTVVLYHAGQEGYFNGLLGVRKRWPLLRSIFNVKAFDRMLKPLIEHTDLPVVRVEDEWLGWNVSERPYGRPTGN
jgi:hypothetical protein